MSVGCQLNILNWHIPTDMDKLEKYSWKSEDFSTKFQTGSSMSVTKSFIWDIDWGLLLKFPIHILGWKDFPGLFFMNLSPGFPWTFRARTKIFWGSFDWGITPQVPHEISNLEIFLWGLFLQYPKKSKQVLLGINGVIDWGTSPWVSHEWRGFQLIGFLHCILRTKIVIVGLTQWAKCSASSW